MNKPTHDDFDERALFTAPAPAPSGNPLARYFRVPGLHVRLPTNGAFLPAGTYRPSTSGEVAILPMRSADELLLRSPDALMSGYAVEKMLESCVPAITAPTDISMPDLDVLFLAIRAATFGDKMEIGFGCPKCQHENTFEIDLPGLLDTAQPVPVENVVRLSDDVVLFVRPYRLRDATVVSLATFNETRRVQAAEANKDLPEQERMTVFNEAYRVVSDLNAKMAAGCVIKVVVPEGEVSDSSQIAEFVANMPRGWFSKLDDKIKEINALGLDKSVAMTCQKCSHEWKSEVEFDPTTFFAPGS